MATVRSSQDVARLHVEGSEQSRRAMPTVVKRPALGLPWQHRQKRLRSIEGLNLRLLVDAQHHGVLRRREIESHDVAHLLKEESVL